MTWRHPHKVFYWTLLCTLPVAFSLHGCSKDCEGADCEEEIEKPMPTQIEGNAIRATFAGKIDPDHLPNYANQPVPSYITRDNGRENPITDQGATLGRVLFYDKHLSIDNTISCASCHQQQFAFSDTALVSRGVQGGVTERHSMRLINARFGEEKKFFWDERAPTLEEQTTMPIQDHHELGFSGESGRPDLQDLIAKLEAIDYYTELFTMVYGDPKITESRMQIALAQFVRSIQSFDSKYDEGYDQDFANFTDSEMRGLQLFSADPNISGGVRIGRGVGCFNCHRPPTFDINPGSGNNGVISVANKPGEIDLDNTRAPTLRDLANPQGELNGPLMHDGSVSTFSQLINRVSLIEVSESNPRIDDLFKMAGTPRVNLNMTKSESDDLIAFLKTLSGKNVYTDERWSDPFAQ